MTGKDSSLAEKWLALVQLAKVHEAKLHEHIRVSRAKSETAYNIQLVGRTASESQDILRGVKIYGDILEKLTEIVWGEAKGLKVARAAPEDYWLWGDEGNTGSVSETQRREAWQQLYPEVKNQVLAELRVSGGLLDEGAIAAKLLEELKKSQSNAELQEKINLLGRGNQELTLALKTWEKMLKFVEHRDNKRLAPLVEEMIDKMQHYMKTLIKLEE
jgi:hypothetical protein